MPIYGLDQYGPAPGTNTYGLSLPPAFLVDPFVAASIDYGRVLVTWNKPSGVIFQYRLLKNRYGFPVNENDGDTLLDSGTPAPGSPPVPYPGSQYVDQNIIPGNYHYYGMYVLVDILNNIWIRAGVTCCLTNADFGSAAMMYNLIPEHFRTQLDGGELTTDAAGNEYLQQFCQVIGWGMDYLRTQYWAAANYLNNPLAMPINDLYNMAAELGLDFSPEVPAYTMRQAVSNATHVFRERGTLAGLRNEVVLRTPWDADITIGKNTLLSDDASQFLNNIALYEPQTYYRVNDIILVHWDHVNNVFIHPDAGRIPWVYGGYYGPVANITAYCYRSLSGANQFNITPGSSNAYWALVKDQDDLWHHMDSQVTSKPGSWEVVDSTATNGIPLPGSATLGTGVAHPLNPATDNTCTSFRIKNQNTTGTASMWGRSVARRNIDLGTITDPGFELGITLPGRHHQNPGWAPGNWPQVFWEPSEQWSWWPSNWWYGPYHIPSYWTLVNCTIAQSGNFSHSGIHSAMVSPQPGVCSAVSPWAACTAGTAVTGNLYVYPPAALSTTLSVFIEWYDQWGTALSTTVSSPYTASAGGWDQLSVSGTAPAGTCYAALGVSYTLAKVTDIIYVDDTALSVSSHQPPTWPVQTIQAIKDGLPVPWVRPSQQWSPTIRYGTNDIVLYQGQPFIALRASLNALPPTNCIPTPEWAPLSENQRIRLAVSAYTSQNMTNVANQTVGVIPFVEWFDRHGVFIGRVFARQPGAAGTVGKPGNLSFDSFTSLSIVNGTIPGGGGNVTLGPWLGSYYSNPTLTGSPTFTRTDPAVTFNWAGASPGPGVPSSGWSASWSNSFTPAFTGTYTFSIQQAGGGCRVSVNGTTIINNWNGPKTSPVSGTIPLNAGTLAVIVVQYYDTVIPPRVITTEHNYTDTIALPSFAPHTVTDLRAYAWTDTTISIAWNAMTQATSYQVRLTYQEPGGPAVRTFTTTEENYTITGLANAQTYGVHVVAINSVAWASEASIVQQTGN